MKYDDSEYFFLNFETDRLDNDAGATHIGMFMAWMVLHELVAAWHHEQHGELLRKLRGRQLSPGDFVLDLMDGKLLADDLSPLGNRFAGWYYEPHYYSDYEEVFGIGGDLPDDFCSVPTTWDSFDRLAPRLDERFKQWKAVAGIW